MRLALATLLFVTACGSGGGFPDAPKPDAPPPLGTFSLIWTLTDGSGSAVTCDQAAATSVVVNVHDDTDNTSFSEQFFCSTGNAVSDVVEPGSYTMKFSLTGSGGVISTSPQQTNLIVQSAKNLAVPPLTFVIPAM